MLNGPIAKGENPGELLVYFGTFTRNSSQGIYVSRLNLSNGKLSTPELAAKTGNPGFLALHPLRAFLYSVDESESGAVNAFAINRKTGKLTFLNQQSSEGKGPCHLVVDKKGECILVANYGGGSIAVLPLRDDGRLEKASAFIQHAGSSVDPRRQKGPHAHSINVDPKNRFAFVADLGLDKIMIYRFDSVKGTLAAHDPPSTAVKPGAGPRHFAFHPNHRFAYVINEMDCTITAFDYDGKNGELEISQTISTLPEGVAVKPGFSTAEVQVHPSGQFVYGSNRGHDSITVFTVNEKTGALTQVQNESAHGKVPRNFAVDPTGQFLLAANQESDSVVVFRIDPESGFIAATGQKIEVPTPVCVKFLEIAETD